MDENDLPGGDVVPTGEQVTDSWAGYQGQPPPPVELPYGQSHELRLQRLTSGLGEVEQNKSLDGPTKANLIGQIMEELGPLQKRKQEAQQQQQQQQMAAVMGQQAQEQAVSAMNLRHSAEVAPGLVKVLPTPTGPIGLMPDGKGGFTQLDLPDQPEQQPPEYERAVADSQQPAIMGPDGLPLTDQPRFRQVRGDDGVLRGQRIPTLQERMAMDAATPDRQAVIAGQIGRGATGQGPGFDPNAPAGPAGDGGPMTIQNGGLVEQYQNGQLVGSNRPPAPQEDQAGSNHVQEARKLLGPEPPRMVAGPHGRPVPNPQYTAYHRQATAIALDMWKTDRQNSGQDEHRRQETAKQDRQARKDDYGKFYKDAYDGLSKEINRVRTANSKADDAKKEPVPGWAADEDAMHAEAVRRANRRMQVVHPDWSPPADRQPATTQTPADGRPTPKPAPKVEPLPAEKATLADVQAEQERRARMKKQKEANDLLNRVTGGHSLADGPAILP